MPFVLFAAATGASGSLTATATLVLAGITLALVFATIWLVLSTRAGTSRAQKDARAELKVLQRQVGSSYRPLLVDVLTSAPPAPDMGAEYDVDSRQGPNATAHEPGPVVWTKLPAIEPSLFDPRTPFVLFQGGKIFLSVPLRNVGRGLAVIDGDDVELAGSLVGSVEYRAIQRHHVPVGETTRIDLITGAYRWDNSYEVVPGRVMFGIAWRLAVPYLDFAGEQRTTATLQIVCRGDQVEGPWLVERVDQGPPQQDEPPINELPVEASSPQPTAAGQPSDARRQQVTDIWGKPIRPRRRRD